MNNHNFLKIFFVLFFSLLAAFVCQAENLPSLPPPLIASKNAGEEYSLHLEKIGQMFHKGETLNFYDEVEKLVAKIDAN